MKKSSIYVNVKKSLLVVFVSMLFFSAFATRVNATPTTVAVDPSLITIDGLGETGTVTINVTEVTDLFAWQIRLYFDNTTLNCTAAWLPLGHVFDGKPNMPGVLTLDVDENGTYVQYGCTLILVEDVFAGSGTLCQINFTGMDLGSFALTFDMTKWWDEAMQSWKNLNTFLLDSNLMDITFDATDGNIDVIPEFPTFALMLLFTTLTLVAIIIAKRKWSNKRYTPHNPPKKWSN